MRKLMILFLISFLLFGCSNQTSKEPIILSACIDGDTARFENIGRVRFLYIDTPEVYPQMQPFGQQAADFACDLLKNASVIYIEYDGEREDKYGRVLGWIWVDDLLLQEEIVSAGLVNRFYDYDYPKYKSRIDQAYRNAKKDKVGMFE